MQREIDTVWAGLAEQDRQAVLQLAYTLAAMAQRGLAVQALGLRTVVRSWHDSVFDKLVSEEIWGDDYAGAVALGGALCGGGEHEPS